MSVNIIYFDRVDSGKPSISHRPVVEIEATPEVAWALVDAATNTRFASAAGLAALAIMMGVETRIWSGGQCSDQVAGRAESGGFFIEDGGTTIYRKTKQGYLLTALEVRTEADNARNSLVWANARSFLAMATKALDDAKLIFEQEVRRAAA
jgi:hypothetical protein